MTGQTHSAFVKRSAVHPHNYKPTRFYEYFKSIYYIPIIFGFSFLPFPISKFRLVRIVFAIYALSMSIGFSCLVLSYVKYVDRSPYIFVAVEYITTVSLLLFMNCDTRALFIKNLELIDEKLNVKRSHYNRIKKVTHLFVVIAIITRILYSTALCFTFQLYCNNSPIIIIISGFVLIAVDTNQIPRLIAFYLIKYRMFLLRKRVEHLLQFDVISFIQSNEKKLSLAGYQTIYENILDSLNIISEHVNPFMLLNLICSFPKIMLLLYNIDVLHQRGMPILPLAILALEAVQWGLIPCLPGIVFEMTRAQVDKMKLFLLQRHKYCYDNTIRKEIKAFLDYIDLRPCRYDLYRLIPVDITLPVGLFHLCTTYFIVIIQFTHVKM